MAWLIALGALTGAVALTAARLGGQYQAAQHAARVLATLAASLVIAISFHFLLALPDGRLARPGRRLVAGLGYASAVGTGIGLAIAGEPFPLMAGALIWPLAVLCALPATRLRYLQGGGPRQGTDAVAGNRPGGGRHRRADQRGSPSARGLARVGRRGGGQRVRGGAAGRDRWRNGRRSRGTAGSVLVHALSAAGSAAVVAVVYLVIVARPRGGARRTPPTARSSASPCLAAAVAAIVYLPVKGGGGVRHQVRVRGT